MGAFNILEGIVECPVCKKTGEFAIQFKYGDTWQHLYHLGDELRWGGNEIGRSSARVKIEGLAEKCPNCKTQWIEMDIISDENILRDIIPVGVTRDKESSEGFEYLE